MTRHRDLTKEPGPFRCADDRRSGFRIDGYKRVSLYAEHVNQIPASVFEIACVERWAEDFL
jgi:hypothetical protein